MNISTAVAQLYKKVTGATINVDNVYTVVDNASLQITPSASGQTFSNPPEGKTGFLPVTVGGDQNLIANNIRNGVTIFGVTGDYSGSTNNQPLSITPTASSQSFTPSGTITGFSPVTVAGDQYLTSSNIKAGVTIFGTTGTYIGSSAFEFVGRSSPTVTIATGYYRNAAGITYSSDTKYTVTGYNTIQCSCLFKYGNKIYLEPDFFVISLRNVSIVYNDAQYAQCVYYENGIIKVGMIPLDGSWDGLPTSKPTGFREVALNDEYYGLNNGGGITLLAGVFSDVNSATSVLLSHSVVSSHTETLHAVLNGASSETVSVVAPWLSGHKITTSYSSGDVAIAFASQSFTSFKGPTVPQINN